MYFNLPGMFDIREYISDIIHFLLYICPFVTGIGLTAVASEIVYRIHKKIRGGFNFVVFVDDKDPQIFFHKKGYDPRNLLHFLLTSRWRN